jgi:hypothetical protein
MALQPQSLGGLFVLPARPARAPGENRRPAPFEVAHPERSTVRAFDTLPLSFKTVVPDSRRVCWEGSQVVSHGKSLISLCGRNYVSIM